MKICFIASHFPQGGAERQITELIKGLRASHYEVSLVLYESDQIFYTELFDLGITIYKRVGSSSEHKIRRWVNNTCFVKAHFKTHTYDILHTYLYHNGLLVRLLAPPRYKNKIIYSIRNSYQDSSKFYRFADKILSYRSVNIFNSKKSMNEFQNMKEFRPSKKLVIYNGYDTNCFNPNNRTKNTTITFGNVGRYTKQKNQIQILESFSTLHKNNFSFKLYLIGDSTLDQADRLNEFILNNGLQKNVILLNAQNDIEKYYKKFDVFILSSLYEGCPNALFEALLSECLCIVSDGANSDTFIKHKTNGLVYNGSTEMLTDQILHSIELVKKQEHKSMIQNGYSYAMLNFTTKSMVEKYKEVYSTLLDVNPIQA